MDGPVLGAKEDFGAVKVNGAGGTGGSCCVPFVHWDLLAQESPSRMGWKANGVSLNQPSTVFPHCLLSSIVFQVTVVAVVASDCCLGCVT